MAGLEPHTDRPGRGDLIRGTPIDGCKLHLLWDGGEYPNLDIIAVHGLNPLSREGHAYNTWAVSADGASICWLRDFLPKRLPNARILMYEYTSNAVRLSWRIIQGDQFDRQALDFLERISSERKGDPLRPVLFVAHSLGGILVKTALCHARLKDSAYHDIRDCPKGLATFSTPHRGSERAEYAIIISGILRGVWGNLFTPYVDNLMKEDRSLTLLNAWFSDYKTEISITSFFETKKMPWVGLIVPEDSATIQHGHLERPVELAADHRHMTKFSDPDRGIGFRILGEIKLLADHVLCRDVTDEQEKWEPKWVTGPVVVPGTDRRYPSSAAHQEHVEPYKVPNSKFTESAFRRDSSPGFVPGLATTTQTAGGGPKHQAEFTQLRSGPEPTGGFCVARDFSQPQKCARPSHTALETCLKCLLVSPLKCTDHCGVCSSLKKPATSIVTRLPSLYPKEQLCQLHAARRGPGASPGPTPAQLGAMAHYHQQNKKEEEQKKRAQLFSAVTREKGIPSPAALSETWYPRRPLTQHEILMAQRAASRPRSQPTIAPPFQAHRPANFNPRGAMDTERAILGRIITPSPRKAFASAPWEAPEHPSGPSPADIFMGPQSQLRSYATRPSALAARELSERNLELLNRRDHRAVALGRGVASPTTSGTRTEYHFPSSSGHSAITPSVARYVKSSAPAGPGSWNHGQGRGRGRGFVPGR